MIALLQLSGYFATITVDRLNMVSEDLPQGQSELHETLPPELLHAVFVDDEPAIRIMTEDVLNDMQEGPFNSLEVFEKPGDVIARFRNGNPPNVLLTDGNMGSGQMTGLELAQLIKLEFPTTTTVLISAGIDGIDIGNEKVLKEHGIDFYLPKPAGLAQMQGLPNKIRTLRQQQKQLPNPQESS